MRRIRFTHALLVALALVAGFAAPALADGVGKIVAVVTQLFGGRVQVTGAPTNNQVLLYSTATNSWGAAAAPVGATPTWAQVLAAGAITGTNDPTISASRILKFTGASTVGLSTNELDGTWLAVGNGTAGDHSYGIYSAGLAVSATGTIGLRGEGSLADAISWGTGGTFDAATHPNIRGPSDTNTYIMAGGTTRSLILGTNGVAGITINSAGATTVTTLGANTSITAGSVGVGTGSLVIKGTTSGSTTITVAAAAGSPATWTLPTATAAAGAALTDVAGNGTLSWVVPSATTPTLGAVVNASNVVNGTAASGRFTWTTGGTYAADATSQVYGNVDGTFFVSAGIPTGSNNGNGLTFTASSSGASTTNTNGGTLTLTAGTGRDFSSFANAGASIVLNGGTSTATGTATYGGDATFTTGVIKAPDGSGATGTQLQLAGGAGTGGTNIAPGGFLIGIGAGTGNAVGTGKIQSGFIGASGSSGQSTYDRMLITSNTKASSAPGTSGTVINYCNISNAVSNSGVGCSVDFIIEVGDGANHWSSICGTVDVAASNRNGTVTATSSAFTVLGVVSDSTTFTALTTTTTATVTGTNVLLKVTPTWAAGTPTVVRVTYQVRANGQTSITPQ